MKNKYFWGGNPRNDLLFSDKNCKEMLGINNQYDKIILFMPTFRKSKIINRIDSTSDFPIISSKNISEINSFLKENKVLLVIKPHPYQNDIEFLNLEFTNIIKFTNEDLAMKNVLLYELLGQVDALVTDYSSVYFDFLLTQKPID
ncbi:CDP-glycerol glycerophosphotransferase family protein [Thermoclostridium stercorarium]|nr:CDP-glycerol glycerophosphotransferase family protein [Thermoclostridium stercorarium]